MIVNLKEFQGKLNFILLFLQVVMFVWEVVLWEFGVYLYINY